MYAFGGAGSRAVTAIGAFFVVYLGEVVFDDDCFFGALAHTLAAAKAAGCASFAGCSSFLEVAARDNRSPPGVLHRDDFIWASLYADGAAGAEVSVHAGKAVF